MDSIPVDLGFETLEAHSFLYASNNCSTAIPGSDILGFLGVFRNHSFEGCSPSMKILTLT